MGKIVRGVDIEKLKLQMKNAYLKGRLKLERKRGKSKNLKGVAKMCREGEELCFEIDKGIWDAVARMKEKGNISIEEVIELGIATHYTTEKTEKERHRTH